MEIRGAIWDFECFCFQFVCVMSFFLELGKFTWERILYFFFAKQLSQG